MVGQVVHLNDSKYIWAASFQLLISQLHSLLSPLRGVAQLTTDRRDRLNARYK